MSHTYRYLVHYLLPAALIVAMFLALFRIHVPWYVVVVVLPASLFVLLSFVGYVGRYYHVTKWQSQHAVGMGLAVRAIRTKLRNDYLDPALWEARQIFQAFQLRMTAEEESIIALCLLKRERRRDCIAGLRRCLESMRQAQTLEQFRQQDILFHILLCALYPNVEEVEKACAFTIHTRPPHTADLAGYDATVLAEHEAIVAALERDDIPGAEWASTVHLNNSRKRFYPHLHEQIGAANSKFFQKMGKGDVLWFASLNVTPIEMVEGFWNSVGQVSARAIEAGAALIYLRPSEQLLQRWRENGIADLRGQEGFRDAFDAFLLKVLWAVDGKIPEAEVRDRVRTVHVDSDRLFDLTRPDNTLGYFHFHQGSDLLTVRESLADDYAWPRILPRTMTSLERSHFLVILTEALSGLPEDDRSALLRWLPRPASAAPVETGRSG